MQRVSRIERSGGRLVADGGKPVNAAPMDETQERSARGLESASMSGVAIDVEQRPVRGVTKLATRAVIGYSINTGAEELTLHIPQKYENHVWGLAAIGWLAIILLIAKKRQRGKDAWSDIIGSLFGLGFSLIKYLP